MGRKKITVIGGAGNVGASTGHLAYLENLGDIVLLDVAADRAQGIGLDILESGNLVRSSASLCGGDDFEASRDSDLIIITAGLPRKPGMSRDDLLQKNVSIVGGVAEKAAKLSPNAVMILVANPLDAMVYTAWKKSGFDPKKVVGMAGVLDCSRFCAFVAMELGVSPESVQVMVLGGHGDTLVPLTSSCTVGGLPLSVFMLTEKIAEMVERTRRAGGEIMHFLKTGSAYYAPAACTIEMAKSILLDQKKVLPCAAYLDGEYCQTGIFVGVPVILGAQGVEKVIDAQLNQEEEQAFNNTLKSVRDLINRVDELLG